MCSPLLTVVYIEIIIAELPALNNQYFVNKRAHTEKAEEKYWGI
ncbi:hypothetical protein HMPREF0262_01295 [Clostridium sp. ATCC 29733]|nr:hypothetical protein HMPREF0262_01295 [Clostridium sp. ATCC 29733]